jgi:AcrR family transcriptional regulator
MSIEHSACRTRHRRSPEASRDNILAAAETILLASGPQDLKLAEVAKGAGVANATVLHHFGSIDGVQTALMERMVRHLVDDVLAITVTEGQGAAFAGEGMTALFDAFESRGAARLAAWLALTGEATRMTGVRGAVQEVIDARISQVGGVSAEVMGDFILGCVTYALGVGLFGAPLGELLGKPPGRARDVALGILQARLDAAVRGVQGPPGPEDAR